MQAYLSKRRKQDSRCWASNGDEVMILTDLLEYSLEGKPPVSTDEFLRIVYAARQNHGHQERLLSGIWVLVPLHIRIILNAGSRMVIDRSLRAPTTRREPKILFDHSGLLDCFEKMFHLPTSADK